MEIANKGVADWIRVFLILCVRSPQPETILLFYSLSAFAKRPQVLSIDRLHNAIQVYLVDCGLSSCSDTYRGEGSIRADEAIIETRKD